MRILVVEDDAAMRAILVKVLAEDGQDVTAAAGEREVLALAAGTTWDPAIADALGPGEDGSGGS